MIPKISAATHVIVSVRGPLITRFGMSITRFEPRNINISVTCKWVFVITLSMGYRIHIYYLSVIKPK